MISGTIVSDYIVTGAGSKKSKIGVRKLHFLPVGRTTKINISPDSMEGGMTL